MEPLIWGWCTLWKLQARRCQSCIIPSRCTMCLGQYICQACVNFTILCNRSQQSFDDFVQVTQEDRFCFCGTLTSWILYLSPRSVWHQEHVIWPRTGRHKDSAEGRWGGRRPSLTLTHMLPWYSGCTVLFIAPVKANSYQMSLENDG